ncbi:hypothetical protein [Enterobacter cloacae complex sp. CARB60]|uniref:hypothetical protein n=1 Tax=Enterobacter cloacae complex sp. CARB60 TaxID=3119569 RepID=UPI002F3FF5B7
MKVNNLILTYFLIVPSSVFAALNCSSNQDGCETVSGLLRSKLNFAGDTDLILNNETILTLPTDEVDEAFVYNNLPYHKNNIKKIDQIIISYNSNSCKLDDAEVNCTKYKLLNFKNKLIISNAFYPKVANSNLMNVTWGTDNVLIKFEDSSVFEFKAGEISLKSGGVEVRSDRFKSQDNITSN